MRHYNRTYKQIGEAMRRRALERECAEIEQAALRAARVAGLCTSCGADLAQGASHSNECAGDA